MNKVMVAFIIITSSTTRIFLSIQNRMNAMQSRISRVVDIYLVMMAKKIQLLFSHSNNINIMKDYYTRRVISLQQ